jgi:hypothetical protein
MLFVTFVGLVSNTFLFFSFLFLIFCTNVIDYEMLLSLDDEVRANAMNGVPQNQIEMLPTFPVPAPKASSTAAPSECSICLEPKVPNEIVRSLPCLHTFHVGCIDPWLQSNAICPVCKYRIVLA